MAGNITERCDLRDLWAVQQIDIVGKSGAVITSIRKVVHRGSDSIRKCQIDDLLYRLAGVTATKSGFTNINVGI